MYNLVKIVTVFQIGAKGGIIKAIPAEAEHFILYRQHPDL